MKNHESDRQNHELHQEYVTDNESIRQRLEAEVDKKAEEFRENNAETEIHNARHEALEQANSHEKLQPAEHRTKSQETERRLRPANKKEKVANYKKTMVEVRSELPLASRGFSKFIHNPVIEKVSDSVGSTIARPNAILSGSIFAFVLTLVIYLVASFYGYPLSGAESIAAFILGWIIGLVFDYIRLLMYGKSQ